MPALRAGDFFMIASDGFGHPARGNDEGLGDGCLQDQDHWDSVQRAEDCEDQHDQERFAQRGDEHPLGDKQEDDNRNETDDKG